MASGRSTPFQAGQTRLGRMTAPGPDLPDDFFMVDGGFHHEADLATYPKQSFKVEVTGAAPLYRAAAPAPQCWTKPLRGEIADWADTN